MGWLREGRGERVVAGGGEGEGNRGVAGGGGDEGGREVRTNALMIHIPQTFITVV